MPWGVCPRPSSGTLSADVSRRSHARLLLALVPLVLVTCLGGCSRATSARGADRLLVRTESDGLTLELVAQQELVTRSPGLREAGRWFGWEDGSTECDVVAEVRLTHARVAPRVSRVPLETSPPGRLFMDEATCAERLEDVASTACAAGGRIAFRLDARWQAVEVFDGRFWLVDAGEVGETPDCHATLASLGSTVELVARSHAFGACDALLTHGVADVATRCVLDYDSMGVGDSLARDGVMAAVDATRAGAPPTSTEVRWAALVAAGGDAGNALDMEASLYGLLLEGEADFRADSTRVGLGLAFTPSRARRLAFIDAAVARCEADRFAEWQRDALAFAAAGLGDAVQSARVKAACGVDPGSVQLHYPSRLLEP